jgi:sugar lactone lactonase YvrE
MPARAGQMIARIEVKTECLLGEGPTWDLERHRLLWLDVDGRKLHELTNGGTHTSTQLDRRVSAMVPDTEGGFVGVAGLDILQFDHLGCAGTIVATLPPDGDGLANDARCDPSGRLWVGTVDRSGANAGGLYCVDTDGKCTKVRDGIALSNGMDWSPDGSLCYYVDSLTHCIQILHLGFDGLPTHTETLVEIEQLPDGLTVDAEGGIWVALWDGGAVHRYTPDGQLDQVVTVPGGFVTSCAFGGSDQTRLFITTARGGLTEEQLRDKPNAGGLFAIDAGVAGRGYTPFGRRTPGGA